MAANATNKDLTTGAHVVTRVAVPFGNGNWQPVQLDPLCKYYLKNLGIDHTGAASANRVKALINSQAEPDAGGVITFGAEADTTIIKPDDVGDAIPPTFITGIAQLSLKGETAEVMVEIVKFPRAL